MRKMNQWLLPVLLLTPLCVGVGAIKRNSPVKASSISFSLSQPVIEVSGGQWRIDLDWEEQLGCLYEIQRSETSDGEYELLTQRPQMTPRYSDFIKVNGQSYFYRVRAIKMKRGNGQPVAISEWSQSVEGRSRAQGTWDLVTDLQRANFEFLWSYAHPKSGLIREGTHQGTDIKHANWLWRCTTVGATGMAFFNYAVGVEREWITREQAAERVYKTLSFLEKSERFHGVWPHWIDGTTGESIPFSEFDDGADIVETAFLAQGLIFVREFFNEPSNQLEADIRQKADELWRGIEWDFFSNGSEEDPFLYWHWSPRHGFKMNLPIRGVTECHIVHLLAMTSPTHPVGRDHYENAWLNPIYSEKRQLEGVDLSLGLGYGGPLFFTHYSYLGFNPKALSFKGKTYFEHYSDLARMQVNYSKRVEKSDTGIWGLTASNDPKGYDVHAPGAKDNGTITPTASLSSWPYAPESALRAFESMYQRGDELWGEYGFYDAYNDRVKWVSHGHVSIDVATIAPMIENHRTGLCWKVFSRAPEFKRMVELGKE